MGLKKRSGPWRTGPLLAVPSPPGAHRAEWESAAVGNLPKREPIRDRDIRPAMGMGYSAPAPASLLNFGVNSFSACARYSWASASRFACVRGYMKAASRPFCVW